jgi:hypothetical protein
MLYVNVETHFASNVGLRVIDHVIVRVLTIGNLKIQQKVKILLGFLPTLNNVRTVGSLLRRIKDVII